MPQPLRVVMSRDGTDADHQHMHAITGVLPDVPHVGEPLQVWRDDGKIMHTSTVRRVVTSGSHLEIETQNSLYHVDVVSPVKPPPH
jgi:hypothetical protein